MKFRPMRIKTRGGLEPWFGRETGFTLVEVLAALVFMAIVIPAAVQGLRIASLAGQVAERKSVAGRLADRLLNETIAMGQAGSATQKGTVQEDQFTYNWQILNESWEITNIRRIVVQVTYAVQGRAYDVSLSTLVDSSPQ